MLNNQIRIIAGRFRGRKLSFASIEGLRPTSDRMRETLFNWLQNKIVGSLCLDLFSGSGAIGFEALSRDAKHVVMVDQSDQVIAQLKENQKVLEVDNASIIKINALDYLRRASETFDLIFIDPPFKDQLISECLAIIKEKNLLSENGFIYLEDDRRLTLDDAWEIHKEKRMGKATAYLIKPNGK
jgi:16S rRNA (guanine966-N2)-methyltransferase